jgi:hypothetical protein
MAPSNALMVEEIINGFPNPVLPNIDHEPTFEDILFTSHLLNANEFHGGRRGSGHLGIIMTQAEYVAISATPWVEPFNPGTIPIIPAGTNKVDTAQISRMHDSFRCIYMNRMNVDYLLQYANRSAHEVLMHLKQTYRFINPTQLTDNYNRMMALIKFQDQIETLFKQIEDGVCYLNAGMQAYMEAQYVKIAFLLILNTGL